ncbi:MAG: hypothetical protein AAGF32_10670, partial [Pseudomonadota bacterium]
MGFARLSTGILILFACALIARISPADAQATDQIKALYFAKKYDALERAANAGHPTALALWAHVLRRRGDI